MLKGYQDKTDGFAKQALHKQRPPICHDTGLVPWAGKPGAHLGPEVQASLQESLLAAPTLSSSVSRYEENRWRNSSHSYSNMHEPGRCGAQSSMPAARRMSLSASYGSPTQEREDFGRLWVSSLPAV